MIKSSVFDKSVISHAFFTKEGGVSEGLYSGLNCGAGSDDTPENVVENKRIAMQKLEIKTDKLATLYQVHSTDVVLISDPSEIQNKPKADAMVTRLPGVALGILTADCVPILFADAKNEVIGAAHSGWKGSVGNIANKVVDAMINEGAERGQITAAIGPSIQQRSYEVGPEFPRPFLKIDARFKRFFEPSERAGHFMFDLTGFVFEQLTDLNIGSVDRLMNDTCTEEDQFFSYRRMCKKGENDYGRMLSAIALKDR